MLNIKGRKVYNFSLCLELIQRYEQVKESRKKRNKAQLKMSPKIKYLEETEASKHKHEDRAKAGKKVLIDNKKTNYIITKKDGQLENLNINKEKQIMRHYTQDFIEYKNKVEICEDFKEPENITKVIKPNFEHEPSASPSSQVVLNKKSNVNIEESKDEYIVESKAKKSSEKPDFRQKDQDNIDEEISSNDSYLDCFIDNAVLNEDCIFKDTPLHEQTITYAKRNELNSMQLIDDEDLDDDKNYYSVTAVKTIIENSPVLLKPIVEFLIKQRQKKSDIYEESKFDAKLNIKHDKGSNDAKLGVEVLFTIDPDSDNLISSSQEVSVYCKFIDFYQKEMNEQTKFLYSLISSEEDSEVIKGHDYTAGTVCNMIMFGVIKCNYDYVRELLSNPENEK